MAHARTLSESQVAVLQWIADGCPPDVMSGRGSHISAAALGRRGLVRTSGSGATWSARLTGAGREYLRRVRGPSPPVPRQDNVSVASQLVDEVLAAGGSLVVPRDGFRDERVRTYERRAQLANCHHKVPVGKRLELRETREHIEIRLIDVAGTVRSSPTPSITVPQRVARLHPVAKAFRDDVDAHRVSRRQLGRAVRILHAVAVEAQRRRWSPNAPERTDEDGHPIAAIKRRNQLVLNIFGTKSWVRVGERGVHTRGWWEEQKRLDRPMHRLLGMPIDPRLAGPSYDAAATGVLVLELISEDDVLFAGRQSRWSDGQRQHLEDRIGLLFREIEERIVEAEQQAELRQRKAESTARLQQQRREALVAEWQDLMTGAQQAWREAMFAAELDRQAGAYTRIYELRRYCDAADRVYGHDARAAEWIAWARDYASRHDPLRQPPAAPALRGPAPGDLQPYLPPGWNALGPPEISSEI